VEPVKKSEMEAHAAAYLDHLDQARAAERAGMYRAALKLAVNAWPYIDGMLQYETKYNEAEIGSVAAIDLALRYAPLLLDLRQLDELETLLKAYKRIDRIASDDIAAKVTHARSQLWENHKLFAHLQQNPGARQDELESTLGGRQERWRVVAESWEKMGLIRRTQIGRTYTLALSTRMGEVVPGKCPSCGHVADAPKGALLEEGTCPECRSRVVFVVLGNHFEGARG
jgi:hypothetical protein